jgi:hypothetical protein
MDNIVMDFNPTNPIEGPLAEEPKEKSSLNLNLLSLSPLLSLGSITLHTKDFGSQ